MGINWRKPVVKGLLLLSGSKILKYLKLMLDLEYKDYEYLERYQREKLKRILMHAYKKVPYYHNALKGIVRNGNVDLSRFSKIPILTKEIMRKEGKKLYSTDYKKRGFYNNSSGGSTGEPVKFIQDKDYYEWTVANKLYYKKSFGGQEIGEKELRLWGSERDILYGKEKLSIRIKMYLYNRKELNSFKMSKDDMKRFVKVWNRYKPRWVEAYAQSAFEFARFIKKNRIKIYSPKGILTSAGTLYPDMKETIKEVFRCNVFNRYGSREVGDMACSCSKDEGLHLSIWNHYVEILNDKLEPCKSGEIGKIYVTTLNNYSMPLIRYNIGDIGEPSDKRFCSCGRKIPLIKSVRGRDVNLFKTKKGDLIDGEFFTHLFYLQPWVTKFQVVQEDYEKIKIRVIGIENKKEMKRIEEAIKKVMGSKCEITWKFVKEIKPLKSGKFLYTISEIK